MVLLKKDILSKIKNMKAEEIRKRFLNFFEKRGHFITPSASLVPENDPSVLFNTAGMQPLVPYLMGLPHPSLSKRIANSQKCLRTVDIEEVGDNTHLTFFEMLGNWSLGDYFKKEAIEWSFEFLTSKEEGLGLDPKRLYVTIFEGDEDAPRDSEAYKIWEEIFKRENIDPEKRIFEMGKKGNWWSPGANGPCGPDSEMFYDVTGSLTEGLSKDEFLVADEKQELMEVWNDVFMEYESKNDEIVGKLKHQNVDTGCGLERITSIVQEKNNVYETDLFLPVMEKIAELAKKDVLKSKRIIADHIRTVVFLIADGALPSNTDQGYVLRRLVRRAIRHADEIGMEKNSLISLVDIIVEKYKSAHLNLLEKKDFIKKEIEKEEKKFRETLEKGIKRFEKIKGEIISGEEAFILFSTYGFPIEMVKELAKERGMKLDEEAFKEEMEKHQNLSRTSSAGKFKGGLSDSSGKTVALHTVTHILLSGLRKYLGEGVFQAGSNINNERARFDFTYHQKVERDILDKIEEYVNDVIKKECDVITEIIDKKEAQEMGVVGSFWEKYPDKVTIYTIKCDNEIISQELCGGPHIKNTKEINGIFKIIKEESVSAGVRRVKAVIE
jgi:alanyl-tRNA synthetase